MMRAALRRLDLVAVATPRRILLAGWLLFVVYAYPGYLSPDPILQLSEARAGNIGDWHPPMMAFLWRHVDHVVAGTFGMLVLQSVPFLLGLHSILGRVLSARKAACAAVAILLFPPVMTTMAVIWKDSQMAGYLMAGTACLLSTRSRWRLVGCGLLWLATAMRYNALGATLPIVLFLFEWRPGTSRLRVHAIAFVTWLAITACATLAGSALADREMHPWYLTAIHDAAGVMHYTAPRTDAEIEKLFLGVTHVHENIASAVDKQYTPWAAYYLAFSDTRVFDYPITSFERDRVRRTWWKLVKHHPLAYLRHRFQVSLCIVGITDHVWEPVWDGYSPDQLTRHVDSLGIAMQHSTIQAAWVHDLQAVGDTGLFRPYVYFFIALALLWPARRSKLDLALLLSGIGYEATSFIAAVADQRYSHWMISCTVVACVRMFVLRYKERRG